MQHVHDGPYTLHFFFFLTFRAETMNWAPIHRAPRKNKRVLLPPVKIKSSARRASNVLTNPINCRRNDEVIAPSIYLNTTYLTRNRFLNKYRFALPKLLGYEIIENRGTESRVSNVQTTPKNCRHKDKSHCPFNVPEYYTFNAKRVP